MDDADPIGYVVALPPECRTLTGAGSRRGDLLRYRSVHWIAVAGAGAKNAEAAARMLLERGARRLISWGCAGALCDDLKPGHLIVPTRVIFTNGMSAASDPRWHERLLAEFTPDTLIRTENLAEASEMVTSSSAKRHFHTTTGAIATDMETGAVFRVAEAGGVPCLAVRSIADTAGVTLPRAAIAALDENGEIDVARMIMRLARSPAEILSLLKLAWAFRSAMRSLSALGHAAVPALGL